MKKNFTRILFLGFCLMIGGASCEPTAEERLQRKAMVEETYQKRLALYQEQHTKSCRKDIMEQAKTIADSTLLANARNVKVVDSIPRPPKPVKPGLPIPKSLEDTSDIAPFLRSKSEDSISLD